MSVRWEREQSERRRQQTSDSSGPVRTKQPILTVTIEDFHRYFCCCARRVGTMFFLLEKRDGTPIVVAGPCWPFCTFVTVPLIIVLSGLVAYFIVLDPEMGLVRHTRTKHSYTIQQCSYPILLKRISALVVCCDIFLNSRNSATCIILRQLP